MMNFLSPNVLLLSKIQAFSKLLLRKTREAERSVALTREVETKQGFGLASFWQLEASQKVDSCDSENIYCFIEIKAGIVLVEEQMEQFAHKMSVQAQEYGT